MVGALAEHGGRPPPGAQKPSFLAGRRVDRRQVAPVGLITVISQAIKWHGPGQPLKEGPVSPGLVCVGSLAAQLLLHTLGAVAGGWGTVGTRGCTLSAWHPHPFSHGFQKGNRAGGGGGGLQVSPLEAELVQCQDSKTPVVVNSLLLEKISDRPETT